MVARLAMAIPFPAHSQNMWRASLLVLIAVLAGCGRNPPATQTPPTTSPASQTNPQSYQAFGVVKELEADGKTVRIKHEEIPGYMLAMTMSFEVRDTNELHGIDVGDVVAFRLWVTEDDGWIDQVKKVATTTNPPVAVNFRCVSSNRFIIRGQKSGNGQRVNTNVIASARPRNSPRLIAFPN